MHRYGLSAARGTPPGGANRHAGRCAMRLRLTNDRNILTIHTSADRGATWQKFDVQMEVSGYHHNVAYDFLSLRPALYAAGSGEARFSNFTYQALCMIIDRRTALLGTPRRRSRRCAPARGADPAAGHRRLAAHDLCRADRDDRPVAGRRARALRRRCRPRRCASAAPIRAYNDRYVFGISRPRMAVFRPAAAERRGGADHARAAAIIGW